jgi:hypothetical protein
MPDIQGVYKTQIDAYRAGQVITEEQHVLISRTVETVTGIGFGRVVRQGTLDNACRSDLTGMTVDNYLGFTCWDRSVQPETPSLYSQYESARILREGVIGVQASKAVAAGSFVSVSLTNGDLNSDAASATQVIIPGARWETSTTAAGLAKVRVG